MTGHDRRTRGSERRTKGRFWRVVLYVVVGGAVAALLLLMVVLAQPRWNSGPDQSVTVTEQITLTREQPGIAVEFEASFESRNYNAGIDGYLEWVRPQGPELAGVDFDRTFWNGGSWLHGTSPEITQRGLNTFRFRWVFELENDVDSVTVPIEARFYAFWSDGSDGPLPDETIVSDLYLKLASIYPFE